jgi:hypothetical protein
MAAERGTLASALLNDGRVLVAGGLDSNHRGHCSVELYDPTTGKFSPAAAAHQAQTTTR